MNYETQCTRLRVQAFQYFLLRGGLFLFRGIQVLLNCIFFVFLSNASILFLKGSKTKKVHAEQVSKPI